MRPFPASPPLRVVVQTGSGLGHPCSPPPAPALRAAPGSAPWGFSPPQGEAAEKHQKQEGQVSRAPAEPWTLCPLHAAQPRAGDGHCPPQPGPLPPGGRPLSVAARAPRPCPAGGSWQTL